MAKDKPVFYSTEMGKKICRAIATSTEGLYKICQKNPDFPCRQTINEWRFDYPEFHDMYYKARQQQVDLLAEETIEIADDGSNDTIVRYNRAGDPVECQNAEWVNRTRLRVDTRKWLASRLLAKIYGEKSESKIEITPHESWIDKLK